MTMLDEWDDEEEPRCLDCGAGLYTQLHDPTCPRAGEDTADLEEDEPE